MVLWLGVITALALYLAAQVEIEGGENSRRIAYAILLAYGKFGVLWGLYAVRGVF